MTTPLPIDQPPRKTQPCDGAALLGRVLISAIFLINGPLKFVHFHDYVAGTGNMLPMPNVAIAFAATLETLGGLALLLGFKARWFALALAIFLIPTTLLFHRFWGLADAAAAQGAMGHFFKNVAIIGGLLMITAMGSGRFSVDRAIKCC